MKYKMNFGLKTKVLALIGFAIVLLGLFLAILMGVNAWYEHSEFVFKKPIEVTLNKPISVKKKEVKMAQIVKITETIPAPEDLETEPEKLIYDYFGLEHYRMAIAVSKCEGLNHPADGFNVNRHIDRPDTIDVGYMRINSANFKLEGCSLLEVATPEGNIACGYKMWDRGDGEEGNEKGNFNAWVGYWNGCALTKYK
jgi:hypothetical protein